MNCPDCEFRSRARGILYFGWKTYAAALSAPAEWVCTWEAFHGLQYFEWLAGGCGHTASPPGVGVLAGACNAMFLHLLTFRSEALESHGSAKRRAICVSRPLQSRKIADHPTCIWNQPAGSWQELAECVEYYAKQHQSPLACDRHK